MHVQYHTQSVFHHCVVTITGESTVQVLLLRLSAQQHQKKRAAKNRCPVMHAGTVYLNDPHRMASITDPS